MAVRFDADGENFSRTLTLGAQSTFTMACWGKISVDRNTWSSFIDLSASTSDGATVQTTGDGTTVNFVTHAAGNTADPAVAFTIGTWYYMAAVYTASTQAMYWRTATDTSWSTAGPDSGPASITCTTFLIGESVFNGEWLNGAVTNAKLWTGALTQAELAREMWQFMPVRTANIIGAWPLRTATDTADVSGNGLTLSGGSGAATETGPDIHWITPYASPLDRRPPGLLTPMTALRLPPRGDATPAGGGPVTYDRSYAGAVTPTSALAKSVGKPLAGSVTPTSTLVRSIAKALAGAVTPAGALVRSVGKPLAGTVTPAGEVTRSVGKPVAGSVTPTGAAVKSVGKPLAGSVTPDGDPALQVGKPLAGSVTPAGTVTRSVGKPLASSVTPTGALSRSVGLTLSGAVATAGTVTRQVGKVLAGTLAPAGALVKQVAKALAGAVTPAGALSSPQFGDDTANATSTAAVTAGRTSTLQVAAGRTSTAAVTGRRTSSPAVSDG